MIRKYLMMAALPAIASLCGAALAAPEILPFEADGMARVLSSEAGHPFVMLVWSLDCTFCHASMKNLSAALLPRGFGIVTVAIEPADEQASASAIAAATAPLGTHASRWAFGQTPAEQLRYQIDPKWHGELPRSYWYDAGGKRVAALSGLLTPRIIAETTARTGGTPAVAP